MKYNRFEELPVWQDAISLAVRIYELRDSGALKSRYSLRNQLERAALSISNNIAEGFERGTTQELLTFLYIARGSAGETRSVLCLCERLQGFSNLELEISDLKAGAEQISRQLRAWCDSLQNSGIRGQRYLTKKSRRQTEEARARKEFLLELEQIKSQRIEQLPNDALKSLGS